MSPPIIKIVNPREQSTITYPNTLREWFMEGGVPDEFYEKGMGLGVISVEGSYLTHPHPKIKTLFDELWVLDVSLDLKFECFNCLVAGFGFPKPTISSDQPLEVSLYGVTFSTHREGGFVELLRGDYRSCFLEYFSRAKK